MYPIYLLSSRWSIPAPSTLDYIPPLPHLLSPFRRSKVEGMEASVKAILTEEKVRVSGVVACSFLYVHDLLGCSPGHLPGVFFSCRGRITIEQREIAWFI